jgi:hypothetical protein
MPKLTPETAEKIAVKDYLDAKGYFHFPLLQGLASYKGLPDRIAIKNGKVYALEIKTKKGKQSEYQFKFQSYWQKAGGNYICGDFEKIVEILR